MDREEFENLYECPWEVNGKRLDDYQSIFKEAYRPMMLECKTIPEMMGVARQFGPFVWGGTVRNLNKLSNYYVEPLKDLFNNTVDVEEYEIELVAPIVLPVVMLQSHLIARKFELPEFYAGLQYIRAVRYPEKEVDTDSASV
jgi:hypothetical protein